MIHTNSVAFPLSGLSAYVGGNGKRTLKKKKKGTPIIVRNLSLSSGSFGINDVLRVMSKNAQNDNVPSPGAGGQLQICAVVKPRCLTHRKYSTISDWYATVRNRFGWKYLTESR